jgi:hypothetical protein
MLPFGRGHRLGNNSSAVANYLINGWTIAGIATAKTGIPVNITMGASGVNPATGQNYAYLQNSGGGNFNSGTDLRPNCSPGTGLKAGISANSAALGNASYLNTAAFQVPTVNTPGSCSRNPATGPGFLEFQSSLIKDFPVRENQRFEFRLEAFNLFNHPNFSNPASKYGAGGFGLINSTSNSPRQLQLGFKYMF